MLVLSKKFNGEPSLHHSESIKWQIVCLRYYYMGFKKSFGRPEALNFIERQKIVIHKIWNKL